MARGRPPKYKPEFIEIAEVTCAELGATDENLAKVFRVSIWAIDKWKQNYPEFLQAIKNGKDVFDRENAEVSLLKRVQGYEYEEVQTEISDTGQVKTQGDKKVFVAGGAQKRTIRKVKKQVIPDPTSCFFWLKNRNPKRWRDIKAMEITGKDGGAVDLNLTVTFVEPKKEST